MRDLEGKDCLDFGATQCRPEAKMTLVWVSYGTRTVKVEQGTADTSNVRVAGKKNAAGWGTWPQRTVISTALPTAEKKFIRVKPRMSSVNDVCSSTRKYSG